MKNIDQAILGGERALFGEKSLYITNTIFEDGESPLKESRDIELRDCMFKWKYPLWYSNNITVSSTVFADTARAGIWYTNGISITDSAIEAPKSFRRSSDISLSRVSLPNAQETLWSCSSVKLRDITAKGDYFAMNSEDMDIEGLTLYGNYSFDGVKNAEIRSSRLITKDAFWNSENVTVHNSFISGEYIGWNAKRLTFINCIIESLQGLCYIDELVMKNCRLLNTTLAFEYSTVNADIRGRVESVLNPKSGQITADEIGTLILDSGKVATDATVISCDSIGEKQLLG